ncbi:MAG: ComEC/Rec2 family competence protein [Myxococcota bacterium]
MHAAARGAAATLAATIGTRPFAAWWFQAVAPSSPLANLFAVPATGFALAPLAGPPPWRPPRSDALAATLGTAVARAL